MLKSLRAVARFFQTTIGWHRIGLVLSLTIITVAGVVLFHLLRDLKVNEVIAAIKAVDYHDLAAAFVFVAGGYFTLTFYDYFALRTIGRHEVPYRIAALSGFTSYSIGHNIGATVFTGGAVRYRIYSGYGLSAIEVAKICFIAGLTFWLGNATVLGLSVSIEPHAAIPIDQLPAWLNRIIALLILLALISYIVWVWTAPREIGQGQWKVKLPNGPSTFVQIVIGLFDLGFCTLAMYMLLPHEPKIGFVTLMVVFISATMLGFASHAPGGLGVFDAAMLVALWQFEKEDLIACLLLFRVLYYLVPFVIALAILGVREILCMRKSDKPPPKLKTVEVSAPLRTEFERKNRRRVTMATNEVNGPVRSGWRGRLREAWQVLVGDGPAGNQSGAVTPPSGRIARPAQVAVIESLIGGLPGPAIVLDREGRVLAYNDAAAAIAPALRRGEPALISLRMPELVDAIRRATRRREPQRVEFFERVPLDRWFEAFVTPVRLASPGEGSTDILLMTFNDLTPLRRVEEMRADFIANASHELRTPLAALLGFIETLQGRAKDDSAAREKFLAIMQVQASRMARLIDDLLSLSRIELNAHLHPNTPVDLAPIVRQVADGLQTLARDRDVDIKVNAPAEPQTVLGDRDELIRALENLVENALKYGAAGKRVDITLTRGQTRAGTAEARLTVRDYGPGIAPEHLPRLTERFYRVDVSDSRAQGGTGLGLALVKHVLNRHGGRLTVESTPGAGAAFTMHVPLSNSISHADTELPVKSEA